MSNTEKYSSYVYLRHCDQGEIEKLIQVKKENIFEEFQRGHIIFN